MSIDCFTVFKFLSYVGKSFSLEDKLSLFLMIFEKIYLQEDEFLDINALSSGR